MAHSTNHFIIFNPNVHFFVYGKACNKLTAYSELHPRFCRIYDKARFLNDFGELGTECPLRVISRKCACDCGRKVAPASREGEVVSISRVRELMSLRQLRKAYIQYVRNEICNNRRTRTTLGERVVMTGNLGNQRCNLVSELEVLVMNEEAAYATEVKCGEEILKIQI